MIFTIRDFKRDEEIKYLKEIEFKDGKQLRREKREAERKNKKTK